MRQWVIVKIIKWILWKNRTYIVLLSISLINNTNYLMWSILSLSHLAWVRNIVWSAKVIVAITRNDAHCKFCNWKSKTASIIRSGVHEWWWKKLKKTYEKTELIYDYSPFYLPILSIVSCDSYPLQLSHMGYNRPKLLLRFIAGTIVTIFAIERAKLLV